MGDRQGQNGPAACKNSPWRFDDFCEHLLVRDSASGTVIGTYRVLTPAQAKRIGGTYTDEEFDLTRLRDIRSQMVEVGRSCVHPDYRKGVVILSLWRALTLFMRSNDLHIMIGCGTIPLRRTSLHNEPFGGHIAASVWAKVESTCLAPIEPVTHLKNGGRRQCDLMNGLWSKKKNSVKKRSNRKQQPKPSLTKCSSFQLLPNLCNMQCDWQPRCVGNLLKQVRLGCPW